MTRQSISAASLVALATLAGCSLLTDVSGLTGSADAGAIVEDAAVEASEASEASANMDSATTLPDSAIEAESSADAGAWAFVGSAGATTSSATGPMTVVASSTVLPGDLVVFGCDAAANGSNSTVLSGLPAGALSQTVLGPSLQAIVSWAIATTKNDNLMLTATPSPLGQFIDCSINTYRGGTVASLVDHFATNGTGSGLTTCHPVATQRGGIAYYTTARYNCSGLPADPHFVQRQTFQGNPSGDFAPADGTTVGTLLNNCSPASPPGDWVCLMVSLSP